MASLYDVVDALSAMRSEMKAVGDEADRTAAKVKDAAKVTATTGGMSSDDGSNPGVRSLGASSTSLGSPGDAEDMAARMVAALDKAARR